MLRPGKIDSATPVLDIGISADTEVRPGQEDANQKLLDFEYSRHFEDAEKSLDEAEKLFNLTLSSWDS